MVLQLDSALRACSIAGVSAIFLHYGQGDLLGDIVKVALGAASVLSAQFWCNALETSSHMPQQVGQAHAIKLCLSCVSIADGTTTEVGRLAEATARWPSGKTKAC